MEIGLALPHKAAQAGGLPPSETEILRLSLHVYAEDRLILRTLCLHPRIFPMISDDFTSDPAKWVVPRSETMVALGARDRQGWFGFGIFVPQTHVQFTAHMGFVPRSYGAEASNAFKKMLAWMWANSTARRIVGEICRDNTLALRFVRRAGFEPYGINRRSYLRGGVLHDQVCLGISKPE